MNMERLKKIFRKAWWFAFIEINLSVMLTVLSLANVLTTQNEIFHVAAVCGIIYVLANIFRMRISFYELADVYKYYFYNLAGYIIFAVVSIVLYWIADSSVYTWMFAVLKVFRFFNGEMNVLYSVIVFHLIMIVAIFFAPIGIEEPPED